MNSLTQYLTLYREHKQEIDLHAPQVINRGRERAYQLLEDARLPKKGEETYDAVSLNEMFAPDYGVNINRVKFPVDMTSTFRCGLPNISTLLAIVVNDSFMPTDLLMRNMPEGLKVMSLAKAAEVYPTFVEKYLNALIPDDNAAAQLNSLLLQDGVMIHVDKGVELAKPIQIVNIFNAVAPMMGVRRIIIVLEAGAKAEVLVCDHSQQPGVEALSNQVVELYVGADASLEYYDLEESSESTSRLSQIFARQERDSRLTINGSTLIGGVTRNYYDVNIVGDNAETNLAGMAIGVDSQVIDNVTCIKHHSVGSKSNQVMKYVLDDQSVGNFYGTIVVDEEAKYTNAYQSNRNVLASTNARMYTRPQLEIYCDEVKCSHGATVGQLDANALFYMRSRGIPLEEARLMLMQAFMADVIDTVNLPSLKIRLQQLVESRLSGNKMLCSECN